jgi:predicted DNA-binding transcriptional regulator YafY
MAHDNYSLSTWRKESEIDLSKSELAGRAFGEIIGYALHNNKHLEIKYNGGSTPQSKRIIRPIRAYHKANEIYLDAFCLSRKAKRVFRIDKIMHAKLIDNELVDIPRTRTQTDSDVDTWLIWLIIAAITISYFLFRR